MNLRDKICVVTGGASGIGRALAERFTAEGAKRVVVVDRDADGVRAVASAVGGVGMTADVSSEDDLRRVIEDTESQHGPIDLFCSNAGILTIGGAEVPTAEWQRIWDVNVMAHVFAARHLVPRMLARGGGYLLNTASAAGLLSQVGSAPYAVTKHAAVAFAEWLAITYGDRGIVVSVLCPQAVRTKMTEDFENGGVAGIDGMLEPSALAQVVVEGLSDERFLILPHPEVAEYVRRKGEDVDRWIRGMRRLQARFGG
ncbi:MAG TPA: SDR family oxidoreductase [Candidatus Binatia bacterium]|jgi:NAD(P)-dependent dehydrogenase (short-subunit alcohol dehydrogenase family)|nr:SDR family oxidoreductase [Candidatus Binatia bacterium]